LNKKNIPKQLAERKQWIVWKNQVRDGERTKIPYNPVTGEPASTADSSTWADLETAYESYREGSFDGIGFVFSEEDSFTGIDLDHCRDAKTGKLDERDAEIVKKLDSYTEVSPSSEGIHIIVEAEKPEGGNRSGDGIEIYDRKRYFTFTGQKLEGTPSEVKHRQEELEQIFEECISGEDEEDSSKPTVSQHSVTEDGLTDEELLEKAANASNGDKFERLYNSTGAAGYESRSEADQALCNLLAFWTGGDPGRIERLFLRSSRGNRDKVRERDDYLKRTINEAIHSTTEYYDPEEYDDDIPSLEEIKNASVLEDTGACKAEPFHEWTFKNVLPSEHFISKYIEEYAEKRTDAYPEYHFGAALNLLSIAAERRIKVNIQPIGFYTNLWINLLGMSTIARKSTALKLAEAVLEHAGLDRKKLPDDYSPESLIDAFEEDGQRVLWNEEFNSFYSQLGKQYMKGSDSLFCKLYDNPSHYKRQLRSDTVEAKDIYFNIMVACIPQQLIQNVSEAEVKSGFFPRMLLIWSERPKETMPLGKISGSTEEIELGEWLSDLNRFLRENQFTEGSREELEAVPTEDALEYYNNWIETVEAKIQKNRRNQDARDLSSFLGRQQAYVMKIACLIEFGSKDFRQRVNRIEDAKSEKGRKLRDEDINQLRISEKSVKYAVFYITKLFLPNQQEFLRQVSANHTKNQIQNVYNHAKKIMGSDAVVGHSKLLQHSHMKSEDFREVIATLHEMSKLEKVYECGGCDKTVFESQVEDECPRCQADLENLKASKPQKYRILDPTEDLKMPDVPLPENDGLSLPEDILVDKSDLKD
jgi:putative DNA primase/helicase